MSDDALDILLRKIKALNEGVMNPKSYSNNDMTIDDCNRMGLLSLQLGAALDDLKRNHDVVKATATVNNIEQEVYQILGLSSQSSRNSSDFDPETALWVYWLIAFLALPIGVGLIKANVPGVGYASWFSLIIAAFTFFIFIDTTKTKFRYGLGPAIFTLFGYAQIRTLEYEGLNNIIPYVLVAIIPLFLHFFRHAHIFWIVVLSLFMSGSLDWMWNKLFQLLT
ncbi:hypothetical protein [Amphritea balenae]|uniref:Uncharacterized protein n=1 Tax=Amphritea balenae TaxID=452629 RepID=A0A3P1SMT7_9GAMM|nr:hypothetical protein [Amphritea balenae]RRC98279.1 hypothetical protein EHS89_14400 [Amphritea balenae]GGK80625.1 hypothetical protein GCM10007941_33750 [Amphritea balenae]